MTDLKSFGRPILRFSKAKSTVFLITLYLCCYFVLCHFTLQTVSVKKSKSDTSTNTSHEVFWQRDVSYINHSIEYIFPNTSSDVLIIHNISVCIASIYCAKYCIVSQVVNFCMDLIHELVHRLQMHTSCSVSSKSILEKRTNIANMPL